MDGRAGVLVCEYLSGGGLREAALDADACELLAAGRAMRDALAADLAVLPGLAPRCADGAGALAPRAGECMADFLRRESQASRWTWVVAPESGGTLATLCAAVPAADWIGCEPGAIALCSSKRATLERLAAHGLPTPLDCAEQATHWVVKPDDGAGTQDTRRHATRRDAESDLAQRAEQGRPATLEPWIDGEALSLSLLCRRAGCELLAINRQRIAIGDDGMLRDEGVLIRQIGLADARAAVLAVLARGVHHAVGGLRGFVGIDLVWHPRRGPVAIEVNPRLTCAYVGLSAALGRNLAGEIVALHEEEAHAKA